jgi:hypothetical protein
MSGRRVEGGYVEFEKKLQEHLHKPFWTSHISHAL